MQSNTGGRKTNTSSNVQDVNATPGGLIKATVGAAVVASAILTFVWLPAEYGIDPTGVGHMLGLTEMGHIKEQLHAEADADAAAASATKTTQTGLSSPAISEQLDAIQLQLTAIAASIESKTPTTNNHVAAQPAAQPAAQNTSKPEPSTDPVTQWRDEFQYSLEPGEGIEVKLVMDEGAVAEFEWSANGAVLNHDTHGDGNGRSISYEKGRSIPQQTGQLIAAFTGKHGWYWRNRTDEVVLVTLRTKGDYKEMALP